MDATRQTVKRGVTFNNEQDTSTCGATKKARRESDGRVALQVHAFQQKTNNDYTAGWICAIPTEYVAAQAILDERHNGVKYVAIGDQNDYTLGRIGRHNVAYGTDSAAVVASNMMNSFPNIRIGLMVGVGGGAPSKRHDIRLGDVVVSKPHGESGGVIQYDFGKTVQGQTFQITRFLNQPPVILRTAINGLMTQYKSEGHKLQEAVNDILKKNPRLQKEFGRPHRSTDRLYRSDFKHPVDIAGECAVSCGDDPSSMIPRQERTQTEDNPAIHYGLVASANQLMKDAIIRDRLASEKDVLCFEMEAAGLMNQFPCLIIRGICDYSDSHKNKEWQGYAALVAAAYAKDLLSRIPSNDIGSLQRVANSSSLQLQSGSRQSLDNEEKHGLLESLRFDQIDARHMTIKIAHTKTCEWLLRKHEYLDWLDPQKIGKHGGFLWIKGNPGTGKSTIMKYAVTNARTEMKDRVAISFFFNARGDNLEKSTVGMYRSLIVQLLERLPFLREVISSLGSTTRYDKGHQWAVEPLKDLFYQTIQRINSASVLCFIDALDKCNEDEIRDMISFFENVGELILPAGIDFRVCFSSRHYPHITILKGLSLILENQEGHAQDIVTYIKRELKIKDGSFANEIRTKLQDKASGIFIWVILVIGILNKGYDRGCVPKALQERLEELPGDLNELFRDILTRDSYNTDELLLCVQLVLFTRRPLRPEQLYSAILREELSELNFNDIAADDVKRRILNSSKGLIEVTKSTIPTVQFIHESVKDFLLKDGLKAIRSDFGENFEGKSHERLKQCCLKFLEMDISTYIDLSSQFVNAPFSQIAGPRQSVNELIPFLDYAVRNILHHANAAEAGGVDQTMFLENFPLEHWVKLDNFFARYKMRRHTLKVSLLYILAEHNLGGLIRYHPSRLSSFKFEEERYGRPICAAIATNSDQAVRVLLEAQLENTPNVSLFRTAYTRYCEDETKQVKFTTNIDFWKGHDLFNDFLRQGADLFAIAFLESKQLDINAKDWAGRTLLWYAVEKGRENVVEWLLERDSEIDSQDRYEQTPLMSAAEGGHEKVVRLLIDRGADIEARGYDRKTPLFYVHKESEDIFNLLLERGVNIEATNNRGQTPLFSAIERNTANGLKALLDKGAHIEARDERGETPLFYTVRNNSSKCLTALLNKGANIEARNNREQTPIFCAVRQENKRCLTALLDKDANIEARDEYGETPICHAVRCKSEEYLIMLLEKGANIEARNNRGQTLIFCAVQHGNIERLEALLNKGADIEARDDDMQTPLMYAISVSVPCTVSCVGTLLRRGANIEARDKIGRTALFYPIGKHPDSWPITFKIIDGGANIEARDSDGQTPLLNAIEKDDYGCFAAFYNEGANIEASNRNGETPLEFALRLGRTKMVMHLEYKASRLREERERRVKL